MKLLTHKNIVLRYSFFLCRYRFSPQFTQNVLAKLDPRDRKLTLDNFIVVSVQVKASFKSSCFVFFSMNH